MISLDCRNVKEISQFNIWSHLTMPSKTNQFINREVLQLILKEQRDIFSQVMFLFIEPTNNQIDDILKKLSEDKERSIDLSNTLKTYYKNMSLPMYSIKLLIKCYFFDKMKTLGYSIGITSSIAKWTIIMLQNNVLGVYSISINSVHLDDGKRQIAFNPQTWQMTDRRVTLKHGKWRIG